MALLLGSEFVDLTVDPQPAAGGGEAGFTSLFDGRSLRNWSVVGSGAFVVVDGRLESVPGDDLGLCWHTVPAPADFELRLRWLRWRHEDTSGVYVRFPHPQPTPHDNSAFIAMQEGFEVQIDEVGIPGATRIHKTGAIYAQVSQQIDARAARPATEWNDFAIVVRGQEYRVHLNGHLVALFHNSDPRRGRASTATVPSYIGLQLCPGSRVAFRDLRIKPL